MKNLLSAHSSLGPPDDAGSSPRARLRLVRLAAAMLTALALIATACGTESATVAEDSEERTERERPVIPAEEPELVPDDRPEDDEREEPQDDGEELLPPDDEPMSESTLQGVAAATVKIISQGTFVPPLELEQAQASGIGTGFIIDQSGLMVTNNHVVTGSAFVEVYLEGSNSPLNARILGVSECSDLAVLDLEGDGYPFLEFRQDMSTVSPGLSVFAAGYPLNFDTDPLAVDYTLTAGIVSTTQASGESNWASVDGVIEHDARIRGGNSGGPLVDEQGRVLGINYAGEDQNDLNFAIAADEAADTIEALKIGDVESLGINGQAIITDTVSGVWVSGVASGSPADGAGLEPGDLILSMENIALATDGTLSDYCDIIRSNGPDDTLAIEVLRLGSEEILEGQINGTPLEQSFSFMQEIADDVGNDQTTVEVAGAYTDFEFVSDDSNVVGAQIPVEWVERDGTFNDNFGESLYAAPDLDAFIETWEVPGIIIERSNNHTFGDIDAVLDEFGSFAENCNERGGREPFATTDGAFSGKWEIFTNCGGTSTALLTLAVSPPDGNSVVRMLVQIVTDADIAAADQAIATFDSAS